MSDTSQGPGWWQASDQKWYPPETHPEYQPPEKGASKLKGFAKKGLDMGKEKLEQQRAEAAERAERNAETLQQYQTQNAAAQTAGPTVDPNRPILTVTSHDAGRNATVTLWPDRIEREREKKMTSLSRAKQDTEVTPMRSVSSVQAKKDGVMYTKVTVYATGNPIEFRLRHDDAQRFKDAVMAQVLAPQPTVPPAPAPASAPAPTEDPVERIRKLGELRDAGLLSAEEFESKKAEILARM